MEGTTTGRRRKTLAERLFSIERIYVEPAALEHVRAHEVLARFPDAERVECPSHRDIPELFGNKGAAKDWIKNKRAVLILGVKKSLYARPNTRSADFIAPSTASGCGGACLYCYVPRNKGYANPVTVFVNIGEVLGYLERHAKRRGAKPEPNQADPEAWVYDIGENSDASADALLSDNVCDLVALFRRLPNAKASFATKFVNRELLAYDPQGRTRVRFSLMPADISRRVDVRTTPIPQRIAAINDFVAAGYEVHLNFSPVIVTDDYLDRYAELFEQIDDELAPDTRRQLACEVIFLTHNEQMHDINVVWHPRGEEVLWRPDLQEAKVSENGGRNLRYQAGFKGHGVRAFIDLLARKLPYCRVRYAF